MFSTAHSLGNVEDKNQDCHFCTIEEFLSWREKENSNNSLLQLTRAACVIIVGVKPPKTNNFT